MALSKELIELIPTLPLIVNKGDINEATRIEEDLGLHGYHARRFIFRYADMFGVDISSFKFNKYFTKEIPMYKLYSKIPSFLKKKKRPLTLGDLEQAINYRKLNDVILTEIAESPKPKVAHRRIKMESLANLKKEEILIFILMGIALSILFGYITLRFV